MLKDLIRNLLQKLLGFDRYLFVFSIVQITLIQWKLSEKSFRHFLTLAPDEGLIVDIGANIGIMTVVLAKKHPHTTLFAYEPIDISRKALERVVRFYRLQNVKIFANAVGDTNGMVKMLMPFAGNAKMQGLSHVVETGKPAPGEEYAVRMHRLDDMPELKSGPRIGAIKIDVENFEYFVLKGGRALLERHRPIVFCELWDNERRDLCFKLMEELGYGVKIFKDDRLVDFSGEMALDFFFLP